MRPAGPTVLRMIGSKLTGYTIQGEAEARATVKIYNSSNDLIGEATVDSEGKYRVVTAVNQLEEGSTFFITATNRLNKTSEKITSKVGTIAPDKPSVTEMKGTKASGYMMTGEAEAKGIVKIYSSSNELLGEARAGHEGKYRMLTLGDV